MDLRSLELKIARSENLPMLPQVVSSVLRLADDPDASPKDMERLIERDPAITAKILRVANSSYYGLSQVGSVGRALSVLGSNAIRSLVVSIAYQQIIAGRQTSTKFDKLEFWRHSVAVATGSKILAKLRSPAKAEEVYGAGMMHDVGLLVMDRFCAAELDQVITRAQIERRPLHEVERDVLGFDHARVGEMLAERWGLTGLIRGAIRYHHTPAEDPNDVEASTFVAVANLLAYQCGFTNSLPLPSPSIPEEMLEAIGVPEAQLDVIRAVIVKDIEQVQDAFQIK